MTAHPAIRTLAHEPCPFCGCPAATVPKPARRGRVASAQLVELGGNVWRSPATGRDYVLRGRSLAWARGILASGRAFYWAPAPLVPRDLTADERTYLAAFGTHRGQRAVIDESTNEIVRWEEVA